MIPCVFGFIIIITGKTTQVPQFLLEAGFSVDGDHGRGGMIAVTEPRRVAAISTAIRVSEELNLPMNQPKIRWNEVEEKKYRKKLRLKQSKRVESTLEKSLRLQEEADEIAGNLLYLNPYNVVGYQVRYDHAHVSKNTRIKFMTDGVLLRELQFDILLSRYSVIIIDEAHERGLNTDVLIGILSRVVKMRRKRWNEYEKKNEMKTEDLDDSECIGPLKLIIMSATLQLSTFTDNTKLFPIVPPVVNIATRTYPVTPHFARTTALENWMPMSLRKLVNMHTRLPPGGILVFVTGNDECEWLCKKMTTLAQNRSERNASKILNLDDDATSVRQEGSFSASQNAENKNNEELFNLSDEEMSDDDDDEKRHGSDKEGEKDSLSASRGKFMENNEMDDVHGVEESEKTSMYALTKLFDSSTINLKVKALPLYSLLPSHLQMRVFEPVAEDTRLVVVATNIAETSLTIPSIKYVLDTGREKRKVYEINTGISRFETCWISQASAAQRMGRAGRTAAGHCYRMYSSAVYSQQFDLFTTPEILRQPLESTVLQMKCMGIERLDLFPFPSPPDSTALQSAEKTLILLGALERRAANINDITDMGRTLSQFPILPRFAKMLILGHQHSCLQHIIAIVAALSVEHILLRMRLSDRKEDEDDDDDSDSDDERVSRNWKGKTAEEKLELKKASEKQQMENTVKQNEKRELYARLQAARERFRTKESDLLTYLRMICAYDEVTRNAEIEAKDVESMRLSKEKNKKKNAFVQDDLSTAKRISIFIGVRQRQFCEDNFIRLKAMQEIESLRGQLRMLLINLVKPSNGQSANKSASSELDEIPSDPLDPQSERTTTTTDELQSEITLSIYNQLVASGTADTAPPLTVPTSKQEVYLRQFILSGFIDHVAQKMTEQQKAAFILKSEMSASVVSASALGTASGRVATPSLNLQGGYSSFITASPLFFSPRSALFPPHNQPPICVFHTLQQSANGKLFMQENTAIEIRWLSSIAKYLCTFGSFLEDPLPKFNEKKDCIIAYQKGQFGPGKGIELPMRASPILPNDLGINRVTSTLSFESAESLFFYRHFCRLFLEGSLFSAMREFVPLYTHAPSRIFNASVQASSVNGKPFWELLELFRQNKIVSKEDLINKWQENKSFALALYSQCIQKGKQSLISQHWPPVLASKPTKRQ